MRFYTHKLEQNPKCSGYEGHFQAFYDSDRQKPEQMH